MMHPSSIPAFLCTLALCAGWGQEPPSSEVAPPRPANSSEVAAPSDPEASALGREHYLGREIARTMHWTGAEWLLRENREDEEQCSLLLENLGELRGKTICDFGCGNGYYTLRLAERVGPRGKVFAVDLQPEMLRMLESRATSAAFQNIETIEASLRTTGLPPASCDGILLVDVYHEISHPVTVLKGLRQALKPGGRLYLVEYRLEDESVPIKLKHKMSKAQVLLEMKANGLRFAGEYDGLPWQHVLAFERDADFPRTTDQDLHNGKAVAEGFQRALRRADVQVLAGFYGENVVLRARGVPSGEAPPVSPVTRAQWRARLDSHMNQRTPVQWKAELARLEFRVEPLRESAGSAADTPQALRLVAMNSARPLDWTFTRLSTGQWLVSDELWLD